MKNLGENSRYMPDLDQHRCTTTTVVSSRSGAAPLAATGMLMCHFVRKIPDVEQHRYYRTVYGSLRSEQEVIMLWIIFGDTLASGRGSASRR